MFGWSVVVQTYPLSVTAKGNLRRKSDILVNLDFKSKYGQNYSTHKYIVLHFVYTAVFFNLSDICVENST